MAAGGLRWPAAALSIVSKSESKDHGSTVVKPGTSVFRRMLQIAWHYRWGCIKPLSIQLTLLTLGVLGLSFTGLAFDIIFHATDPAKPAPKYPLGLHAFDTLPVLTQVLLVGGAILSFSVIRGLLNLAYTVAITRLIQGRLVVDLRASVYDKLQRLSFRFY